MKDFANFPLLFRQIGDYLAKPCAAGKEDSQEAAREAYSTIVDTIYRPAHPVLCPEHPVVYPFGK